MTPTDNTDAHISAQDTATAGPQWTTVVACLVVTAAVCWVSSWLLQPTAGQSYGWQTGDALASQWFHDWTARMLVSGEPLDVLRDFDHPLGRDRARQFPALTDALIGAPINVWLDWPLQWRVTQSLLVGLSALGMGMLAWGLGCRGIGVAFAGVMGALFGPMYTELYIGRLNSCWIGLSAGALGGSLYILQCSGWRRWLLVLPLAVLGAGAAGTYPLYLLMLLPVGVVMLPVLANRQRWQTTLWSVCALVVSMGLALLLFWTDLQSMIAFPREVSHFNDHCPDSFQVLPLRAWLTWLPTQTNQPPTHELAACMTLLAPLAMVNRRGRWMAGVSLPLVVVYALLGAGPCVAWTNTINMVNPTSALYATTQWIWLHVELVHVPIRFGIIAGVLTIAMGGMGLEGVLLWMHRRHSPSRRRAVTAVILAVFAVSLWMAGRLVHTNLSNPARWHSPPKIAAAERIATLPTHLAVAEFPYSEDVNWASVLHAPGSPRTAPLVLLNDSHAISLPSLRWLRQLGVGNTQAPIITRTELVRDGVGLVIFDPSHCDLPLVSDDACSTQTLTAIVDVLGGWQEDPSGYVYWDLQQPPTEATAQAPTFNTPPPMPSPKPPTDRPAETLPPTPSKDPQSSGPAAQSGEPDRQPQNNPHGNSFCGDGSCDAYERRTGCDADCTP